MHEFFKFLFYLLVGICFLFELQVMWHPVKYSRLLAYGAEVSEAEDEAKRNGQESAPTTSRYKWYMAVGLFQLFYWLMALVGFLGFNWWVFVLLVLMGILMELGKGHGLRQNAVLTAVDAGLSAALLLFAVLNTYHLHYSLPQVWQWLT